MRSFYWDLNNARRFLPISGMVTKLISEIKEHGFSDPERILQLISEVDFRSVEPELLRQMYETLEQINVRTMEISTDLQRREISYLVQ